MANKNLAKIAQSYARAPQHEIERHSNMKAEANSVSAKIARVKSALNAGQLDKHVPAKSANAGSAPVARSWGPMMRV